MAAGYVVRLVICVGVILICRTTRATKITSPDCATNGWFCKYAGEFGASGGLTVGSYSYPVSAQWSHNGAFSAFDARPAPLNQFSEGPYSYTATQDGIRFSASADSNYNLSAGASLGATSTVVGYTTDYVGTSNLLPSGAKYAVVYSSNSQWRHYEPSFR